MKILLSLLFLFVSLFSFAGNQTIGGGSGNFSYANPGSTVGAGDTLKINPGGYGTTTTLSNLNGAPNDTLVIMPVNGMGHDVIVTTTLFMINCKFYKFIGFTFIGVTDAINISGNNGNTGGLTGISNMRITQCYFKNVSNNVIRNYNSVIHNFTDTLTLSCYKCQVDSVQMDNINEFWQGSFGAVGQSGGPRDVAMNCTVYNAVTNDMTSNIWLKGIFLRANFSYISEYQSTYIGYTGDVGFFTLGGAGGGFSGVAHDIKISGPRGAWIGRWNCYAYNGSTTDSALWYNIGKWNSSTFGGNYIQSLFSDWISGKISNCPIAMFNVGGGNWPTLNTYYNYVADIGAGFDSPLQRVHIKNCFNFNASFQNGAGFKTPGPIIYEGSGSPTWDTVSNVYGVSATALVIDSSGTWPTYAPLTGSPLISAGVLTQYTGIGKKDLAGFTSVSNNIGPYQYVPSMYLTYTLPSPANTAAGIYNASGILIRQLWSMKSESAGAKSQWWDGLDQFGNIATGGPFSSQLEYYNISANVDGILGNSATTQSGTNSLSALWGQGVDGMDAVQVGSTIYYASGYGEGSPSLWKTTTSNINSRINMIGKTLDCVLEFVASDGTNLYISGYDAFSTTNTFTYAHVISTEAYKTFSSGTTYNTNITNVPLSCIGYNTGSSLYRISGLAVQQSGNFLIQTRTQANQVLIINKNTGATVQTYTITSAGRCAVDGSDNVWICDATNIKQYSINASTGAITATGKTISLTNVGSLRCTANGSAMLAADMTNQQVHAYRTSDGGSLWTYGTGDYRTDATVTNSKFYWVDSTQQYRTFVSPLSDSTFLVGDRQNARTLHIGNDHTTFIEAQSFLQTPYYVYVDPKNQTRIFAKWMEFSYNYTTKAWALVKNWGASVVSSQYDNARNIIRPVTLSNGRTYCMLSGITVGGYHVCELVSGGVLRVTSVNESVGGGESYGIDSLGFLWKCSRPGGGIGTVITYTTYALTGFDGSNNPIWSGTPSTTTTIPATTATNTRGGSITSSVLVTTGGNLILYDYGITDGTTHLGYSVAGVPVGSSAYAWQALPTDKLTYAGPFPGQGQSPENGGYFETGNSEQYGGSFVGVNGNFVIANHHGEFWKQAQTNFYWLLDDRTGLFLYNFGKSWVYYPSTPSGPQYGVVGTAGNALGGAFVHGPDGNDYLWHGDEQIQDGVTKWKINGLSGATIITPTLTANPTPPAAVGTNLMSGFVSGMTNPASGTSGWIRSSLDYSNASGHTTTTVGNKTYNIFETPDLFIDNFIATGNQSVSYTHSLIAPGTRSSNWTQKFDLLYDNTVPNYFSAPPYNSGAYVEILDSLGKIIAETHIATNFSNTEYVVANGVTALSDSSGASISRMWHLSQPSSFSYLNGTLTIKYGSVVSTFTTPFESGANMTQPYTMRLRFFVIIDGGPVTETGKNMGIRNASFILNSPVSSNCNCIPRTKGSVIYFK